MTFLTNAQLPVVGPLAVMKDVRLLIWALSGFVGRKSRIYDTEARKRQLGPGIRQDQPITPAFQYQTNHLRQENGP